jgi:hypothetical protein
MPLLFPHAVKRRSENRIFGTAVKVRFNPWFWSSTRL